MGTLMVIDGLDGSGKSTQEELVFSWLQREWDQIRKISFPDYSQPSSQLVKMYLAGEFGTDPGAVNAYAASSFFAVDRFASYKKFWESPYQEGCPIFAVRYTTSNLIHQMGKLPREEWEAYLSWAQDYEYQKLGLPVPSLVIYLDMLPEISSRLLSQRYCGDEGKRDIHEADLGYLRHCRDAALFAAQAQNWQVICCHREGQPLPVEEVFHAIQHTIRQLLPQHFSSAEGCTAKKKE